MIIQFWNLLLVVLLASVVGALIAGIPGVLLLWSEHRYWRRMSQPPRWPFLPED